MKAERRHELRENDLTHALHVTKDYLDTHGTQVGVGVVILAVVVAAVAFGVRSRAAAIEDNWRRKAELSFTDVEVGRQSLIALASMTEGVSDDDFVFASLVDQGTNALQLAQKVQVPPDAELNEIARRAFEELLSRFPQSPLAVGLANSALASVEQNAFLLDRDPSHRARAERYFDAIINDASLNGTPFQRMAMDRRALHDDVFDIVELVFPDPEPPAQSAADAALAEPVITVEYADPVDSLTNSATDPVDEDPSASETAGTKTDPPTDGPGGSR